jgi:hypothetical protein
MRDTSVRWGLGIGGVGSALGIVVLFIAAHLLPISATDTNQSFELVMGLILIQVLVGFGMFGVMLSGAYYAGVRVERDRLAALREQQEGAGGAPMTTTSADRRGSLIAGLIVMLCYWFVSTLFGLLVPPLPQTPATRGSALDIAERALLSGVFFLVFGAAMGSFGGRSARARVDGVSGASGGTGQSLFDRIVLPPRTPAAAPPPPTSAPSGPAAMPADAPAVHQFPRPSGE